MLFVPFRALGLVSEGGSQDGACVKSNAVLWRRRSAHQSAARSCHRRELSLKQYLWACAPSSPACLIYLHALPRRVRSSTTTWKPPTTLSAQRTPRRGCESPHPQPVSYSLASSSIKACVHQVLVWVHRGLAGVGGAALAVFYLSELGTLCVLLDFASCSWKVRGLILRDQNGAYCTSQSGSLLGSSWRANSCCECLCFCVCARTLQVQQHDCPAKRARHGGIVFHEFSVSSSYTYARVMHVICCIFTSACSVNCVWMYVCVHVLGGLLVMCLYVCVRERWCMRGCG